jgi:hypothetical protein
MLSFRQALVVVGCISIGFAVSAAPRLAARSSEPERWVGAVRPDVTARALEAAQRRISELAQRVEELELQQRRAAESSSEKALELAAVVARNEELAAQNLVLTLESEELSQSRAFEAICAAPGEADPRAQLRYWAKLMRDGESGFRAGLPPEWHTALNLLIRRDRPLDPNNPWGEP